MIKAYLATDLSGFTAQISSLESQLAAKADTSAVSMALASKADASALAAKADASAVSTALSSKADAASMTSALASKADASAMTTALAAKANTSSVPTAATNPPPGVTPVGALGDVTTRFALENHTHRSSVQAARLQVAGGVGRFTWTFPTPYDVGMVPVCTATVQTATNETQPYVVNMLGQPTNTSVTFVVFKATTQTLGGTLLAIAGAVINLFGFAANDTIVNVIARLPSNNP
jgi:hypothetical protein